MFYQPRSPVIARRLELFRRYLLAAYVVLLVCLVLISPQLAQPASATFSINTTDMMDQANSMFNALWPVFGIIVGLTIGVGLAILISNKFASAFKM